MEKENKKIPLWILILLAIFIISTAFLGYKYYLLTRDSAEVIKEEVQKLVDEVSKLMILPKGETPTVATVSDPELLKSQPFFASSIKGDKVLIYTTAQKAILYRPDISKIIEVAPINLGSGTVKQQPPKPVVTEEDTTDTEN